MSAGPFPPRSAFGVVLALLAVGGLTLWLTAGVVRPWTVVGDSMVPTLRDGDRVLVDLRAYRDRAPLAGEVVLVEIPGSGILVKRVSGSLPRAARAAPTEVWVLGDNPARSLDSRTLGPLPVASVVGRVRVRYWPPRRSGVVR